VIKFAWEGLDPGRYRVQIQTPAIREGTLYRLTAAIYVSGLDIESGEILTVQDDGELYSADEFVLRYAGPVEEAAGVIARDLGLLMETMLDSETDVAGIFSDRGVTPPDTLKYFDVPPEVLFENNEDETRFYIETENRTGLLHNLAALLARENINIVSGTIQTLPSGRAEDNLYLQYQGGPLSPVQSQRIADSIHNQPEDRESRSPEAS
jgi:UTP:GlnB (protein PII) uridylyltransferase